MRDEVFEVRGRVRREDRHPPSSVWIAVVDRDWWLHDLLGHGRPSANGRFVVTFQRRAFNLEWLENAARPRPWIRVSVERWVDHEGGRRCEWLPVLDHTPEWPQAGRVLDLGTLTVPHGPIPVGVACAPGSWRCRVRYRASDDDLQAAVEDVVPKVKHTTGFTDLDGPVEWVDALGPALPWPARHFVQAGIAGTYSPADDRIRLSRRVLERLGRDAVRVALGHELVHRGQARRHPELFTDLSELATRDPARHQAMMTNIEGYARYVEERFLRQHWPLAEPVSTRSWPTFLGGLLAPSMFPGLADALRNVQARYDVGSAYYLERDRASRRASRRSRAVRFAPEAWRWLGS